jgi:hypothetical protein
MPFGEAEDSMIPSPYCYEQLQDMWSSGQSKAGG